MFLVRCLLWLLVSGLVLWCAMWLLVSGGWWFSGLSVGGCCFGALFAYGVVLPG